MPISDEQRWEAAKRSGDIARIATTARALTEKNSKVDTSYRFTVCDKMWTPMASVGSDLMEGSGARPRNDCPTGKLMLKGSSPLIQMFMDCRNTLVGVEMETAGSRQNFYTKVHRYRYEKGAWTGNVEMRGIWDILNYYVIWPTWWLPLAAQPISHAIFIWALQTCVENMVAECALRIQSGWLEFVNNGLSLNGDIRAWMGTILQALKRDKLSVQTFGKMLRTPTYVQRTNPFLDTSPMCAKTVRMETCGTVIKDVTRAYGVDTRMELGVDFEQPYAYVVAPEEGEDSNIINCEIADHTPEGWQHIIGGRSPKWLNDLMNATFAWLIDSLMIVVGFSGIPSDLLSGFLNNSFLAFQMVQVYQVRDEVGPFHPAIERFYPTASAPYNIETMFAFINAIFDAQGATTAQVTFRNGDQYALGRDIFEGGLMSLVYHRRTKMITDYIEDTMWRITPTEQTTLVQLGDGRRDEAPLGRIQRFITGAFEAINVITLAPQS
ncbi:gp36 protein [Mycobacteroides abscessus subsp. massiliense]|nr:gp36 protein [Mycobacteroides abscessus subsp. massiliense]